jgi:hypothetical protein
MSSVKESWDTGRPIYDRLPNRNGGYENDPTDWLTSFWDSLFVETKTRVDDIPDRQIDPLRCDEDWLDFLAVLFGWDSEHWQKDWSVSSKRKLLSRSLDFIWERKGSRDVLVYVLDSLEIKNRVMVRGDFIIGTNAVGDLLGANPYEFDVILPTAYKNSSQFPLVRYIVRRFAPCWLEAHYRFDDTPFRVSELIEVSAQLALEDGSGSAIEIQQR